MKKLIIYLLLLCLLAGSAELASAKARTKSKSKKPKISASAKKIKKQKKTVKTATKKGRAVKKKMTVKVISPKVKEMVVVRPEPRPVPVEVKKELVPEKPKTMFTVSPKLGLMSAISSTFGLGCEFAMPVMESLDGMGEIWFVPGNGWSLIGLAGNAVYKFPPVSGMPVNFYAGGGLLYDIISASGWTTTGNFSAFGFQGFGGIDYPIPEAGTVFGQLKYAFASFNYTVGGGSIGGIPIPSQSYTQSAGGFGLEGGYRISF